MAKNKFELKVNQSSQLFRFALWYMETKGKKSKTGRYMSGRYNDFFVKILDGLASGSNKPEFKEEMAVFKEYQAQKDKSSEEILAEKTFKDDPEKLKTWKELQKQLKPHLFK